MKTRAFTTLIALLLIAASAHAQNPQIVNSPNGQAGDRFGQSVSCRGSTTIVGAPGEGNGFGSNVGSVYLYFGFGTQVASVAHDSIFSPGTGGENFGYSVAVVDDVTGDSNPDFLVGSPGAMGFGAVAFLTYNGVSLNLHGTPASSISPTKFGFAVHKLGDVWDGVPGPSGAKDGVADVVATDPGRMSNEGAVFVVDGANQFVSPPIVASDPAPLEELGFSVTTLSDMDADGNPEIVAGAPKFAASNRGRVKVFSFDTVGTGSTELGTILGQRLGEQFGFSVASVGDVNADGVDDVLIGAPGNPGVGPEGRVYLLSGASIGSTPDFLCVIETPETGTSFGSSVARLGDINGDGRPDFGVGTPDADTAPPLPSAANQGRIDIFTFDFATTSCSSLGNIGGFQTTGYQNGVSIAGMCDYGLPNDDFVYGARSDSPALNTGSVSFYQSDFTPPSFDPPTAIDLRFKISREGVFNGRIDLDQLPENQDCVARLLGRIKIGNDVGQRFLIDEDSLDGTSLDIVGAQINRAGRVNGFRPELHMGVEVECMPAAAPVITPDMVTTIHSNIAARYANCGTCDGPTLSVPDWVSDIRNTVQMSPTQTQLKRFRKVKRKIRRRKLRRFRRTGKRSCSRR